jgi:ribosomal protein S17
MNQIYSGTVVSQKNNTKTVSVEIISHYRHPKYQKVIEHRKEI